MDTAKVEVILRAVELGSLSKAAEEYLYTPSAVSHMVNSLEDEIGTKIIRRTHMGIEPEEGSEHIFSYLRKLVETKNKIRELAAGANTLTIGTYASLFKSVFPGIIKSFKKKYPEVDINIIVHDDLKVLYEKSHPDIIFGENLENADMEWEALITDPYVAVFPKTYEKKTVVTRDELCAQSFIMAKDSKISDYMNEGCMHDVIKINSHDDIAVIQMIKEEMGVAILPHLAIKNISDIKTSELNPPLNRVLGIMYGKRDFKEKYYIRRFVECIRSADVYENFKSI